MGHKNILDAERAALLVVDVQEAFRSVIPEFELLASRISIVVRGFQTIGLPIFVTEQYPKGLGRTAEEILLALPDDFPLSKRRRLAHAALDLSTYFEKPGSHRS